MLKRGFSALLTTALVAATVATVATGATGATGATATGATAVAAANGPIAYTKHWRVLHTPGPDERSDVFTVRPDGSGNHRLTHFRDARTPKWSPTDRMIAFGRPGEVWVMDEDGSDQRRLTDGYLVDWMPDGDRVLVMRGENQPAEDPTWVLHTVATGEEEQLPIDLPLVVGLEEPYEDYSEWSFAGDPVLSPDGETLALMMWRYDDDGSGYGYYFGSIFTVALDGTGLTRIPGYRDSWGISAWSPNGQQLLYWSEEPRGYCASWIRSVRLDGSGGAVSIDKRCAQPSPTWSPDGKKILFVSGRSNSLQIASKDGKRNRNVIPRVDGVYREEPDWRGIP